MKPILHSDKFSTQNFPLFMINESAITEDYEFASIKNKIKKSQKTGLIIAKMTDDGIAIIHGHKEVEAARQIGRQSIEIELGDITEEQEKDILALLYRCEELTAITHDILKLTKSQRFDYTSHVDTKNTEFGRLCNLNTEILKTVGEHNFDAKHTVTKLQALTLAMFDSDNQDVLHEHLIDNALNDTAFNNYLLSQFKPIESSLFDSTPCTTCKSNSNNMGSVNATLTSQCTNTQCYIQKEAEFHHAEIEQVREKYGNIIVLGSNSERTHFVTPSHVGEQVFETKCKTCASYKNVYFESGLKKGEVAFEQCIKLTCFDKHAEAHKAELERSVKAPVAKKENKGNTQGSGSEDKSNTIGNYDSDEHKGLRKAAMKSAESEAINRTIAKLCQQPSFTLALAVQIISSVMDGGHFNVTSVTNPFQYDKSKAIDEIEMLVSKVFDSKTSSTKVNMERIALNLVSELGVIEEMKRDWRPTNENLAYMTKAKRVEILTESGFDKAYTEAKGAKAWTALTKAKDNKQIPTIVQFDFNWHDYSPSFIDTIVTR